MLLEWIVTEGWVIPVWWLLVTLAGVAALPLIVRVLGSLPDRGYTFARAIGLLLVGFVYWFFGMLGFFDNSVSNILLAWVIVLTLSLTAFFRLGQTFDWRSYWRENKRHIILAEVLFVTLFVSWTVYRAYQNDTFTTEKPMEMAFISGIMRSESFPPNDPWMAGYSISYYYFGYLMSAMLSMLSGVNSGIGFSLTSSMWFALAGLSAYGVGYNLARSRAFGAQRQLLPDAPRHRPALLAGLLTFVLVTFSGNFQLPLIEYPHRADLAPAGYYDFWQAQGFLDVSQDDRCTADGISPLSTPITQPEVWNCGGWWWWHTSRILVDYNLEGEAVGNQPIDEVPAFSFLLMDNHPHVLALPFVLMTIGLALNIVLQGNNPNRYQMLFYGLIAGGLVFLNTWDGPIYMAILLGAEALRRLIHNGTGRLYISDWFALVGFGLILIVVTLIAYGPFLISFRSQAGGLLPNVLTPTLIQQYVLMFGPVLLLSLALLVVEAWRGMQQGRMNWSLGWTVSLVIGATLALILIVMVLVSALVPGIRNSVTQLVAQAGGWDAVLSVVIQRRIAFALLPIGLLTILATVVARLFPRHVLKAWRGETDVPYVPQSGFALLLIAAAAGLTLIPEFIFLRDNFGVRINTIFKFYYQAWVLFGVAGAYAAYTILSDMRLPRPNIGLRTAFTGMLGFILVTGMAYPIFGVYSRAILEQGRQSRPPEQQAALTLDGRGDNLSADYYQAVLCLGNQVLTDDVVVAEASRDSYNSAYGRVGAFTGLPTVINWEGHQGQWRGPTYGDIAAGRRPDIDRLYGDLRWEIALEVIQRYGIDYIVYGPTERAQYGFEGEEKFTENLPVICEFGDARVYSVSRDLAALP